MKFIKNLANRTRGLSTIFRKPIIGALLGGITGCILGVFTVFRLSGVEIVLNIDNKEILIQGILVASTAIIGVTGVFLAGIWLSVAARFTQRVSVISQMLLYISLILGLLSVAFAILWCFDSKDIWIRSNLTCFFLQIILFVGAIPLLKISK